MKKGVGILQRLSKEAAKRGKFGLPILRGFSRHPKKPVFGEAPMDLQRAERMASTVLASSKGPREDFHIFEKANREIQVPEDIKSCKQLFKTKEMVRIALENNEPRFKQMMEKLALGHLLPIFNLAISLNLNILQDLCKDQTLKELNNILEGIEDKENQLAKKALMEIAWDLVEGLNYIEKFVTQLGGSLNETHEEYINLSCQLLNPVIQIFGKEYIELLTALLPKVSNKATEEKVNILLKRIDEVSKMSPEELTREFLRAYQAEEFLKTEKHLEFLFDRENGLFKIEEKDPESKRSISLFKFENLALDSQLSTLERLFEEIPNLQSLVVDRSPVPIPRVKGSKTPWQFKLEEYNPQMVTNFPFYHKFVDKPELKGYYHSVVFDREFYRVEGKRFFYDRSGSENKSIPVLDTMNTALALFMGNGDRPVPASVHLAGLLNEERILEALATVPTHDRADQYVDLNNLYNLLGGLVIMEDGVLKGCSKCQAEDMENSSSKMLQESNRVMAYYHTLEKIYRGELDSKYTGKLSASTVHYSMASVDEGNQTMAVLSESTFSQTIYLLLEQLRQKRLSGFEPMSFERASIAREIHAESIEYNPIGVLDPLSNLSSHKMTESPRDKRFFEKVASIETIFGAIESILPQFMDMALSDQSFMVYEKKRTDLLDTQILSDWNPAFYDFFSGSNSDRDRFCPMEGVLLPAVGDPDKQIEGRVIYRDDDPKRLAKLEDAIAKKIEATAEERKRRSLIKGPSLTKDDSKPGKGRKLKNRIQLKQDKEKEELQAMFDERYARKGKKPYQK